MKNRTGQNWTAEELELVSASYLAHESLLQIANNMGRSYMAIVSRLQRLGLMDELGNRVVKAEVSR